MVDDPIDSLIIRNKGDDLHRAAALQTDHGVDFVGLRFLAAKARTSGRCP
jgi:hypothetical protein